MNTYVIKDPNGETVLTLNANTIDEAWDKASLLVGAEILGFTIERQITSSASTLDPMWILMGALLVVMLLGSRQRRRLSH